MLNVSEIVAKTEEMFDLFNHHFYADELTRPAITVSPDGGHGAVGLSSIYEIWQGNGEAYREINICAEYIDRPIGEVAATMLHELAHLYDLTLQGREQQRLLPQHEIQRDGRGPRPAHRAARHLLLDDYDLDRGNGGMAGHAARHG